MGSSNSQIKKYNITIPKLFETILKLDQEQKEKLLKYAERLLVEDKRLSVRKPCNIPANYAARNRIYVDYIKNISKSGIFIETDKPLITGEEMLISFNMPGYDRPIKIKGEIVQANGRGVGVEYKQISPYIAQMIGALVKRIKG